jgi:hypothetical protein
MSEGISQALLLAAGIYLAAGMVFATAFLTRGIERIDPAAHGSSAAFRLLLAPGVAALWPILARRWLSGATGPPQERDAHVRAAASEETP